jgi:lipid II:glycine glycyltransferase (peptidoglycan interpeptide bridge formation enzyme)
LPAQGVADRRPTPAPRLRLVEISDEEAWHREASNFADHDYRQTWAWGSCSAIRTGARPEYVAVVDRDGDVVGLVSVRVKQLAGSVGIAYASGGPLVRHWADGDDLSPGRRRLTAVLRVLTAEYALRRRLVLRIVPSPAPPDWADVQRQVFEAAGFAPTTRMPRQRTIIVDLDVEPEQLRASFAQKWRNCLNRAEREPLRIRADRSTQLLDNFLPLHDELVARKGFIPGLPAAFFVDVQRRLPLHSRFHVALADAADTLAAGHVTAIVGDTAVYVLGASNEEGRRRKAAYLLQWHAMAAARAAGCRWYDLGGIDPAANPDGYHFKRGIGGVDVTAAGPYEIRPPGLSGHAALAAEAAYHRLGRQLGRFSGRRHRVS